MSEERQSKQRLILVVDDDPDYLYQTKVELEAQGHTVISAESAAQAEGLAAEQKPDLVVADLMMETDDAGFRLCYRLKRLYPELPIVMITGVASETGMPFDSVSDSGQSWLKADVLLDKPIRYEQLHQEVARLLRD